jgi:hypothetical protein
MRFLRLPRTALYGRKLPSDNGKVSSEVQVTWAHKLGQNYRIVVNPEFSSRVYPDLDIRANALGAASGQPTKLWRWCSFIACAQIEESVGDGKACLSVSASLEEWLDRLPYTQQSKPRHNYLSQAPIDQIWLSVSGEGAK